MFFEENLLNLNLKEYEIFGKIFKNFAKIVFKKYLKILNYSKFLSILKIIELYLSI